MEHQLSIKRALISVYHKERLERILSLLQQLEVEIVSTGGTQKFIQELGYPCTAVEDYTGYPSIFGGRVKTLHPCIMGGILARRRHEEDVSECEMYEVPYIDLVVVDLYPFEATLAAGASREEVIEKIDVGGVSLIRAAAKNFNDVLLCPAMVYYPYLESLLSRGAKSTIKERMEMARAGFELTSRYDQFISEYFREVLKDKCASSAQDQISSPRRVLRYGENPHQQAEFNGNLDGLFTQLNGKDLSYNNLLDIDSALRLCTDIHTEEIVFGIFKHNNPCGLAIGSTLCEAYTKALAADPESAYGGIFITNSVVDLAAAEEIDKMFFEVLLATGYDAQALEVLKKKKNRIILEYAPHITFADKYSRSCLNGLLEQATDGLTESTSDLKLMSETTAEPAMIQDLLLANTIVKHCKSNAIVILKGQQLLAAGVGQTSRIDALRQACEKARRLGFSLEGAVMASDAFFPFRDCVDRAAEEGIQAIVQPGGSVRDQESIDAANVHRIALYFTGNRHFRH